jgi:hypothetical protein
MTEKIATCMEHQTTAGSNMQALVGICHGNADKILSQGSDIKSFQHWLTKVEEVTGVVKRNTEQIQAQETATKTLQNLTGSIQHRMTQV